MKCCNGLERREVSYNDWQYVQLYIETDGVDLKKF